MKLSAIETNSQLASFKALSKVLPDLIDRKDMAVWATDEEKFLFFDIYGRFQIKIKAGDSLTPGGTPDVVLRTHQKVSRYVPPEVYGIVCKTIAIPVESGVIGVSFSVEKEEEIQNALVSLDSAVDHISEASSAIAKDSLDVTSFMAAIADSLKQTDAHLREINQIGRLINNIAENSRYISINALLEARRAGEHGRGFIITAEEMKKLSEETHQSVDHVHKNLQKINQMFGQLQAAVLDATQKVKRQSESTTDIAHDLKKISSTVREIEALSKQL